MTCWPCSWHLLTQFPVPFHVTVNSHMKKDIQEKTKKLSEVKKVDEKLTERLKQVT